jgi:tol-pal system protein YbgF
VIRRAAVSVPVIVLLATGCGGGASLERVRTNVADLQGELAELRRAREELVRELALLRSETTAQQSRTMELTSAVTESRTELAGVRARLEAVETEVRSTRTPNVTPAPAARVAPPPAPAPARAPETPARDPGAEQTYQAALAAFRAREHGQAVLDLLAFIARHPGHPLVGNAQYWIGEAYYVQHDYRQAMAEFARVGEIAPASPKVADALLKVGLCQRRLRDEPGARQTWQRLVREFARSDAAGRARALLAGDADTARR